MKHQMLHHGGDMEPKFTLKVVGSHKTALSRQIMEAVRIRRRVGSGAILNSKGEFNRAHIPRLVLEDREEEDEELLRKEQILKDRELDKWLEDWEEDRSKSKEQERSNLLAKKGKPGSSKGRKREQEVTQKQKRSKRLQYQVLNDDWGEIVPPSLAGAECWLQWTTRGTRRWLW